MENVFQRVMKGAYQQFTAEGDMPAYTFFFGLKDYPEIPVFCIRILPADEEGNVFVTTFDAADEEGYIQNTAMMDIGTKEQLLDDLGYGSFASDMEQVLQSWL